MELACRPHVHANRFHQRVQRLTSGTAPSCQRGTIEIDAFASVDLLLPVERKVVGVLRDQHMGKQARTGKTAVDRPRGSWSLHDAVARIAASLRPHMKKHLEACTYVLQHLGHVFAQSTFLAAAVGAAVMVRHLRMDKILEGESEPKHTTRSS